MNLNIYIARQPILDMQEEIFAYELLYRDSNLSSEITNDRYATVSVLNSALNKFSIKELLGNHKAFIKADKKFLSHDVIFTIPKEHFIFALQPSIQIVPFLKDRISSLYKKGYTLAINDVILTKKVLDDFSDILSYISYIKVDIKTSEENLALLEKYNIKVIFTKVETHEMYEKAKKFNVDFVQGYYFSKPKILQQEKFDTDNLAVIKLCNFIMSDKSIDEIVHEFENNHAILLNLLRFINSGTFHFRQKISSIKQVLTLMGKTPLTQWLMLMVYSSKITQDTKNGESPLMILVKSRTDLMVEVSKYIKHSGIDNLKSKSYFVGVLSLMDTLFNVKLEIILKELNIDTEIKEALLNYGGILGEIYKFAKDLEAFNIKEIEEFTQKYNIEIENLEALTFEVIKNTNEFEKTRTK